MNEHLNSRIQPVQDCGASLLPVARQLKISMCMSFWKAGVVFLTLALSGHLQLFLYLSSQQVRGSTVVTGWST